MLGKFKRLELQDLISFDIHFLVGWFVSVLLKVFVHIFFIINLYNCRKRILLMGKILILVA